MNTVFSALQNLVFKELESLNQPATKPSKNVDWSSIFEQEISKMNSLPGGVASGPNGQTVQPNNTPPAVLSHRQSSMPVNLNAFWNDSQVHAYNQTGHAESSSDAVAQDLAIASQDAQRVPQNEYALYGHIPRGQSVLSGYEGRSFYITNVNGTLYRSAVPVAISPAVAK